MEDTQENELNIEILNLSTRTYNCLKKNNINTIKELMNLSNIELMKYRNLGVKSLNELNDMIQKLAIGEFRFEFADYGSNKAIENSDITILELISNRNKKILKILYYDENKNYQDDIRLEDTNLSVRSLNALVNNNIKSTSQLISLKMTSFERIKNLGAKSKREIIEKLKSIVHCIYDEEIINEMNPIKEISNYIFMEYEQSLVKYDENMLKSNIFMIIKSKFNIIDTSSKEIGKLIGSEEFLQKIYNNNFLTDLLKKYIFNIMKKSGGLIELSKIREGLPNHLKHSDLLKNLLNELIGTIKIEQVENNYRIWYPKLSEYMNSLKDERNKIILYNRFLGETLEEIGKKLKLSKQRIRQLEKKAVNRIPRIREDDYKDSFKKYKWTLELFRYSYNESNLVYGYLNSKYDIGDENIEGILEDYNIPISVRLKAEKMIFKDYIML